MSAKLTSPAPTKEDIIRGASIMLAIEISSSFKLYSYHIIDHSEYQNRIKELVDFYLHQIKEYNPILKKV